MSDAINQYVWTASGTNIEERWKQYGWIKPSDLPEYKAKWKFFQELPLRGLDDRAKEEYERVMKKAKVARIK
jgi:hypothetical protein